MEKNEKKLIEEKTFEVVVLIDLETETVTSAMGATVERLNHQRTDYVGREWVLLQHSLKECEILGGKLIRATITVTMRNKCFFED